MVALFHPVDPAFADRVRNSFHRQGFMALLGATLTRIEPGSVDIEVPYRADLTQQHGFFHAGYTLFPTGSSVLTVEFKINLIAPAQGNRLCATGRVVKHGRTLTICAFDVYALSPADASGHGTEQRTLCATGMQTLICLHGRADA